MPGTAAISSAISDQHRHSHPAASPQEQAWLVFQAMDRTDDIVLLLETDGDDASSDAVIVGINGAFRRASGFTDAQVIGRPVAELFPNHDETAVLLATIRNHGTLRAEMQCSRADGSIFMIGLHLMPAPPRTQGHPCFAVLACDLTAVLQARKMQNSIQRLLAKVFISVDEAVAIVDGGGRIVMTNPQVDRLLGYAPNGLVGRRSLELVAPDGREAIAALRKQQLERSEDITYWAPLLRADGSTLDTRITSVFVGSDELKLFRILTLRADSGAAVEMRSQTAGRIRLVGLDEVRAALGDRWPAVAVRAMATAETVIRRRCGAQDSVDRIDDTSFLMSFGSLSEAEASFRAAVIGREIRERLIGQGTDVDAAEVRTIAAAVRFPDRQETGAALRALLLAGLDEQMERIEGEAREVLQTALASATCLLERISGRNPEQTVAMLVRLSNDMERKLFCALSVLPRRATDAFDLDGLLLGLAAQQALDALENADATKLLVNVRFDVFGTRASTDRYVSLCAKLDPRVCKRLTLLLTSPPEGLPRSRQLEFVNRLRPYCAAVGFQVDEVAQLAVIDLSQTANPLVALPATALLGIAPDRLRELVAGLHTKRARVLVRRIGTEDDAAAVLAQGVDMISMEPAEA